MSDFLQSIIDRDPAAKSKLSLILTYPGVKAVFFHRIANFFSNHWKKFSIGSNAVVTKNVSEKSIMVGIPATKVGDATKGFQPYAVTDKDKD